MSSPVLEAHYFNILEDKLSHQIKVKLVTMNFQ